MRAGNLKALTLRVLLLLLAIATPALAQTVTVSPTSATLTAGSSRRINAYVNGVPSLNVRWSVNGIAGGNASVGTVDSHGNYTAPTVPPPTFTVTVTATSKANASRSAHCNVSIRNRTPHIASLSPSSLTVGPFTLRVSGSNFVDGARVQWNGTALPTTFQSANLLIATGTTSTTSTAAITVDNPGPQAVSSPVFLSVRAAPTPTRTATIPTATRPPATATSTRIPATATFTRIPPTATATRVPPTPTRTSVPPTATFTRIPPTATRVPPTATFTMPMNPTSTPMQSATATRAASPTPTATIRTSATPTRTSGTNPTPSGVPATATPGTDPLAITYGRFLEQTSFGPTQQSTARLAQLGLTAYLDEQLAMAESSWPAVATVERNQLIDVFFANAFTGQDQLRQRVIYALSEIIVEARNKNTNPDEILPWIMILSRNAFGNYRTLLTEITLDGGMGKYLDLANSGLMGGAANENYPREVMQLFSIGLYRLNLDGSLQLDGAGAPIPTYTQADVQQLAKALTGWTWGNASGTPPTNQNSNYYPGPMLPVANRHDVSSKTVLGEVIPANQTAQQDLADAIGIIFSHPNVGPFIGTRLIRALITSNPSPAYIARVATVFDDNGAGVRGDMRAVVRAIVLDPEARNDAPPANFGRLRTPMQHTIAMARALNLDPGPASQFAYLFSYMNESILDAPSVFGHYSPMYRIPHTNLFGPEFQIYSLSDAINRANFLYSLMYQYPYNPRLQPFLDVAGNATALVNAVDRALLFGRMASATRSALLTALPAMPDNIARMLTALYLTSMSGEYLVQR